MRSDLQISRNSRSAMRLAIASVIAALAFLALALVPGKAFAAIDEVEDNGSFETATPINMNESVYGISDDWEEDFFKVYVPQSGAIKITYYNDKRSDSGLMYSFTVYDNYFEENKQLWGMKDFSSTRPVAETVNMKKGMNYICIYNRAHSSDPHPYHFKLTYVIPGTTIKKVTPAKKAFTVKWTKKSGAAQYQIRYSKNKSMSGAKTINASKAASSKKIKGLSKNKKYYVKIRVAKNIGGQTYWSSWSSRKSVRTR